tara:strand:+ start:137 stop:511 length:375 start_codon:yes stop_codon:yes gene_type:complete
MEEIAELIKEKILKRVWSFEQISNLKETVKSISSEIYSELPISKRVIMIREVRINEDCLGMSIEDTIRNIGLTYLNGEIALVVKEMLSKATIDFGGNKNEISERSMGGKSHKERPADEKNDSVQ